VSDDLDAPAVTALRLSAQLLAGTPARDPTAVARRLLAIQGQDPRGARLAIRARTEGLTATDVDRALTDERSLLITWLNRGTLHLVASEDYHWLHALTTPPLQTFNARRLAQEGVTPAEAERGVSVIERALGDEGPLTRAQLRERLTRVGVRTEGQALVHVLFAAGLRGTTVRGPMVGGEHAYALVADWITATAPIPRERALARLARRYLAGHGPAGDRDLAKWAGLPLRDARAGLAAIASELRARSDGLVALSGQPAIEELPRPRLLGAFEPMLLGWTSREPILGYDPARIVAGGRFAPFALVNGRAVAVWKYAGGEVCIEPFADLSPTEIHALENDALDVARFLSGRPEIR
jgi:Winged helix DNA-binding domain